MFPLRDENPTSLRPYVTWTLIVLNIAIFSLQITLFLGSSINLITIFGLIPKKVIAEGTYYTFFTSMFLHGGLVHIFGNMLYLYIFGDNIEDMCGRMNFLIFYFLCGIAASLVYLLSASNSTIPVIGASGAISGVLGGYVTLFPKVRIKTAIPLFIIVQVIYLPAYVLIGFWFAYQLLFVSMGAQTGVAYWAHIGGFLAGMALIKPFARRRHLHPIYAKETY
ncbi:MAG: rhomboid family intramembrane serine protease [Candidatus Hydrothermarchaeota archaeon]